MLNAEILLGIYKQCDLESCIALSQVCSESHVLFNSLDESVLRAKVLERVPWFDLRDSNASTWQEAVRIVVSRTAKALDDKNLNLYLVKDLKVTAYLGCNKVVHCDKIGKGDEGVKAVFDRLKLEVSEVADEGAAADGKDPKAEEKASEETASSADGTKAEDTTVKGEDKSSRSEMSTSTSEKSSTEGDKVSVVAEKSTPSEETGSTAEKIPEAEANGSKAEDAKAEEAGSSESPTPSESDPDDISCTVTAPSGAQVCNTDGPIKILGENDKLIHVRFDSYEGEGDFLIHKETHEWRDKDDGTFNVHEHETMVTLGPSPSGAKDTVEGGTVHLLPGSAGALVITHKGEDSPAHRQMLFYVLPNKELTHVLICTLPPSLTYRAAYSEGDTKFFTTYDGYLFVYLAGRLIRLWVDLGYRTELIDNLEIDEHLEGVQNRCLTVWNRNFPLIGSFSETVKESPQGFQIQREGRYVTVGGVRGRVGDLKSGKMFISQRIEDVQDKPKTTLDSYRSLDTEYTWQLTPDEEKVQNIKLARQRELEAKIEAKKKAEELRLKEEKLKLKEQKKEQKREEKRLRREKREKKRAERFERELEEEVRLDVERRRAQGLGESGDDVDDDDDIEVLDVKDKDVIEISSGSDIDTSSESDSLSDNDSHTGETEEEEEEDSDVDSVAEFCKREFGTVDADDHWERVYQDREYERERYYRDGPSSSSEDDDEWDDENPYDYCDYSEFRQQPVIYKHLYRELPRPVLNPTTMNGAAAFLPVYHSRNGKRVAREPRKYERYKPRRDYWRE